MARVGHERKCPVKVSGRPHEGGPVLPVSAATVLVGGQPVAVVGDLAVCKGGDDTIAKGEMTVLVGAQGPSGGLSARGAAVPARHQDKLLGRLEVTAKDWHWGIPAKASPGP